MLKRLVMITALLVLTLANPVKASEVETHKAWATAYNLTGTTATGTHTTEGRTVAGKREWFGSTLVMWIDDGDGLIKPENYIGTYIVEDTGGETIRKGYVLDVYISDYERAVEFGSKRVIFQIVKAEG